VGPRAPRAPGEPVMCSEGRETVVRLARDAADAGHPSPKDRLQGHCERAEVLGRAHWRDYSPAHRVLSRAGGGRLLRPALGLPQRPGCEGMDGGPLPAGGEWISSAPEPGPAEATGANQDCTRAAGSAGVLRTELLRARVHGRALMYPWGGRGSENPTWAVPSWLHVPQNHVKLRYHSPCRV